MVESTVVGRGTVVGKPRRTRRARRNLSDRNDPSRAWLGDERVFPATIVSKCAGTELNRHSPKACGLRPRGLANAQPTRVVRSRGGRQAAPRCSTRTLFSPSTQNRSRTCKHPGLSRAALRDGVSGRVVSIENSPECNRTTPGWTTGLCCKSGPTRNRTVQVVSSGR